MKIKTLAIVPAAMAMALTIGCASKERGQMLSAQADAAQQTADQALEAAASAQAAAASAQATADDALAEASSAAIAAEEANEKVDRVLQ